MMASSICTITVDEWTVSEWVLAAYNRAICDIHQTPDKDKTPEQKARLQQLRNACIEVHEERIKLNMARYK